MPTNTLPFDYLIETIYAENGQIPLLQYHLNRLQHSCRLLQLSDKYLSLEKIKITLIATAQSTAYTSAFKIRLAVSIKNCNLTELQIQTEAIIPFQETIAVNIFHYTNKKSLNFSRFKSNDRALFNELITARQNTHFNDTVLINEQGFVSEATISNVFILQSGEWLTPPLQDRCVEGVMRNYLLHHTKELGIQCKEQSFTFEDLYNAEEIFLTNAVRGLMPVYLLEDKRITTIQSLSLSKRINDAVFEAGS